MSEAKKSLNESNINLLKRFNKRVKSSGLLRRLKNERYHERAKSAYKQKKDALKRLARRAELERLIKLGKMADVFNRKPNEGQTT